MPLVRRGHTTMKLTTGIQVTNANVHKVFETLMADLKEQLKVTGYHIDSVGVQIATHEIRQSLLLPGKRTKWGLAAIDRIE